MRLYPDPFAFLQPQWPCRLRLRFCSCRIQLFRLSALLLIEWPEFIKDLIPENAIEVNITHVQDNVRNIKVTSNDKELLEGLK